MWLNTIQNWQSGTATVTSCTFFKRRHLYTSNVPPQSEGQVFGCNSASLHSDGDVPLYSSEGYTSPLWIHSHTVFGTNSKYRTLLFWEIFEGTILKQRGMQNLTICLCLDFSSQPPNSLCFLLFMAEYAECKETSQKICIKETQLVIWTYLLRWACSGLSPSGNTTQTELGAPIST